SLVGADRESVRATLPLARAAHTDRSAQRAQVRAEERAPPQADARDRARSILVRRMVRRLEPHSARTRRTRNDRTPSARSILADENRLETARPARSRRRTRSNSTTQAQLPHITLDTSLITSPCVDTFRVRRGLNRRPFSCHQIELAARFDRCTQRATRVASP